MTKGKRIATRRGFAMLFSLSMILPAAVPAASVYAGEAGEDISAVYQDEGYHLVWNDEFSGSDLSTKDWNVEEHDPGWVNAELQRYTKLEEGNIEVSDGVLKLYPKAEEKKKAAPGTLVDVLGGKGFGEGWTGAGSVGTDGKALVEITNAGVNPWDVQYQKTGMTLVQGHNYRFIIKGKADTARTIQLNVSNMTTYAPYGNSTFTLGTTEDEYSFDFTMGACEEGNAGLQINLGHFDDTAEGSALTRVEFSDVKLIDLSESNSSSGEEAGEADLKNDYLYTSGRISTQNKHDFTYGRFEARARVPEGQGYLPAFWLMATDDDNYGQWPLGGEIDIMEVMGQDVSKSYHTIHFGAPDHAEDQGTLVLGKDEKNFSEDYHIYTLDWEPGSLTWYVDGRKVHEAHSWASGRDDESTLAYPAPFDQDFYVILNLAVGGSWVGYPDKAAVEDMENQSFDIDYVRVYQKDASEYAKMEAEVKKPEDKPYREADAEGNYVRNGDFSKNLKPMDSQGDNFELHLEADAAGTTYEIKDNEIVIRPDTVGDKLYSVQLKQNEIPMIRGWNYRVTYEAYAEVEDGETRPVTVDVKGPDRNWCLYLEENQVELTNKKQEYSHEFSISTKSDGNGVLEFNLGAQGASAPVHISNVKLVHVSGEEITAPDKTVRADGNYIYNGSFDQGDDRLRYWEIDSVNEASEVKVTNDIVDGERKRELRAKVVVPQGATELEPVIISQRDIAPIVKGLYELSFNAYTEDGSSDGMKALVAGKKYKPELGKDKKDFRYVLNFEESKTREESEVSFIFYKPGTYYIDNVKLMESAMIKNGSFDSGMAGYQSGVYNEGKGSFSVVEEEDGHDTVLQAKIDNIGTADWHIQLKEGKIKLEKGKYYKLTFDAKASTERVINVCMQENGGSWSVYSGAKALYTVKDQWQSFENTFEMTAETDDDVFFSVALGNLGEEVGAHSVFLDNVKLVEVDKDGNPLAGSEESPIDTTSEEYVIEFPGWVKNSIGWRYDLGDAFYLRNTWKEIEGKWYYFNKAGYMATGLKEIDGEKYFFKSNGAMASGWKEIEGKWYFFKAGGAAAKGWTKVRGTWYYFKDNGVMASEEYYGGYWLDKDGAWTGTARASWKKNARGWWFGDSEGWFAKDRSLTIDGKTYRFNKEGYCVNP